MNKEKRYPNIETRKYEKCAPVVRLLTYTGGFTASTKDIKIRKYDLRLTDRIIQKHDVLMFFNDAHLKEVLPRVKMSTDKSKCLKNPIIKKGSRPKVFTQELEKSILKKMDRIYQSRGKEQYPVVIVYLLNGLRVKGVLRGFSKYILTVQLKYEVSVNIYKHAVADFQIVEE